MLVCKLLIKAILKMKWQFAVLCEIRLYTTTPLSLNQNSWQKGVCVPPVPCTTGDRFSTQSWFNLVRKMHCTFRNSLCRSVHCCLTNSLSFHPSMHWVCPAPINSRLLSNLSFLPPPPPKLNKLMKKEDVEHT